MIFIFGPLTCVLWHMLEFPYKLDSKTNSPQIRLILFLLIYIF